MENKKPSDSDVITKKKKQVWFFWNVSKVIPLIVFLFDKIFSKTFYRQFTNW